MLPRYAVMHNWLDVAICWEARKSDQQERLMNFIEEKGE